MPRRKLFRYEANWSKNEDYYEVIKKAWGCIVFHYNKVKLIKECLNRCRDRLVAWSKIANGNQRKLIQQKRELIKELQASNTGQSSELIKNLQKEVDCYLEEEDMKWRQRAKERWLQNGEKKKNTNFFNKCVTQRKQDNAIHKLANGEV